MSALKWNAPKSSSKIKFGTSYSI